MLHRTTQSQLDRRGSTRIASFSALYYDTILAWQWRLFTITGQFYRNIPAVPRLPHLPVSVHVVLTPKQRLLCHTGVPAKPQLCVSSGDVWCGSLFPSHGTKKIQRNAKDERTRQRLLRYLASRECSQDAPLILGVQQKQKQQQQQQQQGGGSGAPEPVCAATMDSLGWRCSLSTLSTPNSWLW
ncbi:hypothetical protein E2C01_045822 [Portunus trituberculatus]|uniref:Uncharacterized protein n=1 Tax=Portunus trituberculatus TaxID=210409 RepID=A0A5B7G612_PORTR|nr:hypothetical protein [Portunus trituberculatus]